MRVRASCIGLPYKRLSLRKVSVGGSAKVNVCFGSWAARRGWIVLAVVLVSNRGSAQLAEIDCAAALSESEPAQLFPVRPEQTPRLFA